MQCCSHIFDNIHLSFEFLTSAVHKVCSQLGTASLDKYLNACVTIKQTTNSIRSTSALANGFSYNYTIWPEKMSRISLGNRVKMVKHFRWNGKSRLRWVNGCFNLLLIWNWMTWSFIFARRHAVRQHWDATIIIMLWLYTTSLTGTESSKVLSLQH